MYKNGARYERMFVIGRRMDAKSENRFAYADGTPYYPFGTTAYAWIHQTAALRSATLQTLAEGPFNKIRMCLFPKNYSFNAQEPELFPFEGGV